jgi:outer membrane usher protein FimD/PapC
MRLVQVLLLILFVLMVPVTTYAQAASPTQAQQQGKGVSGRIVDENGEPLMGVTVVVPGTQKMTVTDKNGQFFLAGADANDMLEVSYIGKQTVRRKAGASPMRIVS